MATFKFGEVVAVPFPFVDKAASKRRPALVISALSFNQSGQTIMAMITTKMHGSWPGDTNINDYEAIGLSLPCIVRLKIFTLDNRLIARSIGALSDQDTDRITRELRRYLPLKKPVA